jgi:hypothetical protein
MCNKSHSWSSYQTYNIFTQQLFALYTGIIARACSMIAVEMVEEVRRGVHVRGRARVDMSQRVSRLQKHVQLIQQPRAAAPSLSTPFALRQVLPVLSARYYVWSRRASPAAKTIEELIEAEWPSTCEARPTTSSSQDRPGSHQPYSSSTVDKRLWALEA